MAQSVMQMVRSGYVYLVTGLLLAHISHALGNAVLFSAHLDSVATSPGATDDGMSVVSLVQMVEYLSKNRPRRTFVANINNGEEDGLNGAHS